MSSAATVRDTGKRIVHLCGEVGMERGIDLALELVHARWRTRAAGDVWANAAAEIALSQKDLPGGVHSFESTTQLMTLTEISEGNFPFSARVAREIYKLTGDERDRDLRQALHELFEWLLTAKLSKVSRAGLQHMTPEPLARLLTALASPSTSVLDPACGMGSILMEAAKTGSRELLGIEMVPAVARLAQMRLELAGFAADIRVGDAMKPASWPAQASTVIIDPPHRSPTSGVRSSRDRFLEKAVAGSLDTSWVMKAVHDLGWGQQALILLPLTHTFGAIGEFLISALLDLGCVEAVVRISPDVGVRASIPLSLWVLRRPQQHPERLQVLMVDSATIDAPSNAPGRLEEETADELASIFRRWRAGHRDLGDTTVARAVPHEEIHREGVLDPARYLEKAPDVWGLRPSPPVHLMSELRISNFKSFGLPTTIIPLKPLTLLYGKNSSGKSSVLQTIQLLRQSLPEDGLITQGRHTDAGSFRTCVHKHDTTQTIDIGLTFGNNTAAALRDGDPSPASLRSMDYKFSIGENQRADKVDVTCTLGSSAFGFQIISGSEDGNHATSQLSLDTQQVEQLMKIVAAPGSIYTSLPQRNSHANSGSVTRLLRKINMSRVFIAADGLIPGTSLVTDLAKGGVTEREVTTAESYIRKGLKLAAGIGRELSSLLDGMAYLGPLRQAPQRVHVQSNTADPSDQLAKSLFDNRSEQVQISEWMQRIGLPYDLEVLALGSGKGSEILGDPLAISLTHKQSGVTLSPSDVGFGVSQVLPILVELSARQNSLICIEQPEIHLHPAMQSEMADLLIESIDPAGRANQIIAESHSEHLVLRIQRRIREGVLDPRLVSVLYVDQDEEGEAVVIPLRIDDDGDFIDPWPNGFFEERLDEVFAGL